jgi:hypothetical protein
MWIFLRFFVDFTVLKQFGVRIHIFFQGIALLYNLDHCTEVPFACFLSGEFITAIVVNPPEKKSAKCTSVH